VTGGTSSNKIGDGEKIAGVSADALDFGLTKSTDREIDRCHIGLDDARECTEVTQIAFIGIHILAHIRLDCVVGRLFRVGTAAAGSP